MMRPDSFAFRSSESMTASEQLRALIERACDSFRPEPDLALCLEIAELINSKKANTPRDAAVAVVRLVNSRNQHVSMLALFLLDILVKNCSFPFHLQVATKEFLNELVRRFPERPPPLAPPPMAKILELIHEWKNTICVTSKFKEDLSHIRDMHRLLTYKGYRFPDYDRRAAAVLNPGDTLKSPDELEEEDRAAQAAKLQELIRRGTPKDLAAAQQLMKVMSGAEPDKKPDYESQTRKELHMVQQRVLMLNDMLNNAKPTERFVSGDAYDQIAQRCKQVQPKLQKWISEAEERNPEHMDKLLTINDLINQILERYAAFRRGDRTAVAEIDPALLKSVTSKATGGKSRSGKGGAGSAPAAQPNLIDFDESAAQPSPSPTPSPSGGGQAASSSSGLEALSGLSLGEPSAAPAPTSAAGPSTSSSNDLFSLDMGAPSTSSAPPAASPGFNWGMQSTTTSGPGNAAGMGAISLSGPPSRPGSVNNAAAASRTSSPLASAGTGAHPNYFSPAPAAPPGGKPSAVGGPQSMASQSMSGSLPQSPAMPQQQAQSQQQQQTQPKKDPFEDLLS